MITATSNVSTLVTALEREIDDELKAKVIELTQRLIIDSPVDTHHFQGNWEMRGRGNMVYEISNYTDNYGKILWNGRLFLNGRWYGSLQGWGRDGGEVFVENFVREMHI